MASAAAALHASYPFIPGYSSEAGCCGRCSASIEFSSVTDFGNVSDIELNLNSPQINAILDAGVSATVAYARQHSPFYRQKLAGAPEVHRVADLELLPLTTKHEVSQLNDQFWCTGRESFVDLCTTSGTTGVPSLYPLTAPDLDRLGFNEFLCFKRVGLSRGDVVVLAVTMDKCFMAGLAYFEGLRQLGVTAIRVGAGSPAMLLSMIDRLRPTAIVSVPSFLKRVAEYAAQHGFNLSASPVRKLICIGEPVRHSDFNLTPLGAYIARQWNAQVFSTYGITELATSFCECTAGKGGHLHPQLLHAEIIDEAGHPVPEGKEGQLVATTIGVQAMPLVRFATGDITFITHQQCECGLWTARIGPILGRKDQAMKLKGTTVYPAAVQRALQAIDQIIDYVMIVSAPTPLSDELEIVAAWRGETSGALEIIREKLGGELKVRPTVRLASLHEIQTLGDSRELRKQRVFIDRRA
jgi:phenylacetate-CoA ligase